MLAAHPRVGAAYHASVTGMDVSAEVAELLDLTGTVDGPVDTVPGGPLASGRPWSSIPSTDTGSDRST